MEIGGHKVEGMSKMREYIPVEIFNKWARESRNVRMHIIVNQDDSSG